MLPISKHEIDRKALVEKILRWNSHRLDLFELSMPDSNGSFNGVMRFFYQDEFGRYQTKCIRVCSEWTTVKVVDILHAKFSFSRSLSHKNFSIYEHHSTTDLPRRLADNECPLLVQLNWNIQDRDGKFVLKSELQTTTPQLANGCTGNDSSNRRSNPNSRHSRRRWSLRRSVKNTSSFGARRGLLGCAAVLTAARHKQENRPRRSVPVSKGFGCLMNQQNVPASYCDKQSAALSVSLPESSFTRTKIDDENAFGRIRQQTLGAKLLQIVQNPGPNMGGTLKIYGGHVCPEVPYRTLLLAGSDSVRDVLLQCLDKYGLGSANVNDFCLVMRVRSPSDILNNLLGTEVILADTDRPLERLFASSTENGSVTFEFRHRSYLSKSHPNDCVSRSGEPLFSPRTADSASCPSRSNRYSSELDTVFACLIEVDDQCGAGAPVGTVYPLPVHKGQVCIGTATTSDSAHPYVVTLSASCWPNVDPYHLIIWRPPVPPGVTASMAAADATTRRGGWLACRPCARASQTQSKFSTVYVNNRLLTQTADNHACVYWLSPGDLIRLGTGSRLLKICPGDGSTVPRLMTKSTPSSSSQFSSTKRIPPANCFDSSLRQRARDIVSPTSPSSTGTPALSAFRSDEYTHTNFTPLTYFSPLSYSSANAITKISPNAQFENIPAHPQWSTEDNRVSIHSPSASSSSLSGSPVPGTGSPVGDWLISVTETCRAKSIASNSHINAHLPSRSSIQPADRSSVKSNPMKNSSDGTALPSQIQCVPPFNPIPLGPQSPGFVAGLNIQHIAEPKLIDHHINISNLSSDCPDSISSSPASGSVQSPTQQCSSHKSNRYKPSATTTISDRLPCQLAFAPNAVKQMLDWLIPQSLQYPSSDQPSRLSECPLGPAISVYLMLRAIHRQCDRWEMVESRQLTKKQFCQSRGDLLTSQFNLAELVARQRQRRQRELLGFALGAVEHLQYFEGLISDKHSYCVNPSNITNDSDFHRLLTSSAAWLANASQLLHLLTRDADFSRTFELQCHTSDKPSEPSADDITAHSAWGLLQDQLTDVVQSAFSLLTVICCTRLDQVALPQLLSTLSLSVAVQLESTKDNLSPDSADWFSDERFCDTSANEPDAVLDMLTDTLRSLHAAYLNPAFVVQLFARLLHRLNAQLFNFVLGSQPSDNVSVNDSPLSDCRPHISPAWGRALYRWIRTGLCAWAITEGLSVAAECYLQRASQAAELMLADISSVESLYNVVVDLVGLNSRQVHALLTGYRRDLVSCAATNDDANQQSPQCDRQSIPEPWIDFVVSGVKLVADRLLAEEESAQSLEPTSDQYTGWTPNLREPLDLLLPLLLPEDSYLTDNPIPVGATYDESVSCDSGVFSNRPTSAKESDQPVDSNSDPLITVDSIRHFLEPAIKAGWCRLSVRPIQDGPSRCPQYLSWSAYLASPTTARSVSSPSSPETSEPDRPDKQLCKQTCSKPVDSSLTKSSVDTQSSTLTPDLDTGESHKQVDAVINGSTSSVESHLTISVPSTHLASFCCQHRPFTVVVPKVDQSLGLSIVAAKSEDGHDLGIYIRAVIPESGASQARLHHPQTSDSCSVITYPLLQPGDRLLTVNGQSVLGLSQEAAAHLVSSSGPEVVLTVVRNVNARSIFDNSDSAQLSTVISDTGRCPECALQNVLISTANQSGHISKDSANSTFVSSSNSPLQTGKSLTPPPAPSALGPVLHLQNTTVQESVTRNSELDTCCTSILSSSQLLSGSPMIHLHFSSSVNRDCLSSESVAICESGNTSRRHHYSDRANESFGARKRFSPTSSVFTDSTLSQSRDLGPSESRFHSISDRPESVFVCHTYGPRGQDVGPASDQPCHRPKGQSASFDEWISTSRLKELCDELASTLSFRPDQNECSAGTEYANITRRPKLKSIHSLAYEPSIQDSHRTNDFRRSVNSRTLPSRVSASSRHPGYLSPLTSTLSNPHSSVTCPIRGSRTNGNRSNTLASRSVGDLPLMDANSCVLVNDDSPHLALRSTRLIGRPVQRRHTTLTTSRFNLGPRPEPPIHVPFKSVKTS